METSETKEEDAATTPGSETIEVWKCSYGKSYYIVERLGDIMDEISVCDPGEKYVVEKVVMRLAEFDALPEFSGF